MGRPTERRPASFECGSSRSRKDDPLDGYIKIETAGSYEIKIGADDYGYFTLGGQTASIPDPGQYRESDPVTVELEAGWH